MVSLSTLEKKGSRIVIENGECQIQMEKDLVAVRKRDGKLYKMKFVVDDRGKGVLVLLEVMVEFGTGEWVILVVMRRSSLAWQ